MQEKPTTRSKPQEPHRTRTRPLSQNTTIQEGAKLLFDELGNFMFPLSLIGEKGFQLRSHHGIKKAIRGIAWLILRKPDLHRQRRNLYASSGGGDVPGDIVINGGTVMLRAERSPSGKGRLYTIVATARDVVGNTTTMTAMCSVPNDVDPSKP